MAIKIEKKGEHIEPEPDPTEAFPVRTAVADRGADDCSSIAELASGIAHEINNPLNGIINYAQILLNRLADRKSEAEIAARIIFEGERISGIVRSLMTFTAQDNDIKSLYTLEELLSVCLDLSHAQLKEDGIRLMLDIKDALPPMLVDASRMRLIFLNIHQQCAACPQRKISIVPLQQDAEHQRPEKRKPSRDFCVCGIP